MLNNIAMVKTADFDVSWILFLSWRWQNSLFLNVMYQNILFLINFTGWKSFNLLSNYTLQLYWQFFFPCIFIITSTRVRLTTIFKWCLLKKSQQLKRENSSRIEPTPMMPNSISFNCAMFYGTIGSRNNLIC